MVSCGPERDPTTDRAMLAPMEEHLERTREFFGARAGGWDAHFHDDGPRYEAAAAELLARPARIVVDLGCGTGRAIPALRRAAGAGAAIVAVDVTPEMLAAAARERVSGRWCARPRRRPRAPPAARDGRRVLRRRTPRARAGSDRVAEVAGVIRGRRRRASRCSIRSVGPRSPRATNASCSPTNCSILRCSPVSSSARVGPSRCSTMRRRATSRSRVAPRSRRGRAASPCSSTSWRSRGIDTGRSHARWARTR